MQGSFFIDKFQKIVDKNVDSASEMFYRETVGNKTKLISSDISTGVGGLMNIETGTRRPHSRHGVRGVIITKKPKLKIEGHKSAKSKNNNRKSNTPVNKENNAANSGSQDTFLRDGEENKATEPGTGWNVEDKNELSVNKQKDKEYVILVSGFVNFKDFSKLWSPAMPFVMEGVNMYSVLKRAIEDLLKQTLGNVQSNLSNTHVSTFHEHLISMWKQILSSQEHILQYGVSETVRAGETRVIHRLYNSDIFSFIYNDSIADNLLERLRMYLRRSDLTRTMFSETVGLYICWNGVIMNNRSTINEQKTMFEQFNSSFYIFARFVKLRECDIRSQIENAGNELFYS